MRADYLTALLAFSLWWTGCGPQSEQPDGGLDGDVQDDADVPVEDDGDVAEEAIDADLDSSVDAEGSCVTLAGTWQAEVLEPAEPNDCMERDIAQPGFVVDLVVDDGVPCGEVYWTDDWTRSGYTFNRQWWIEVGPGGPVGEGGLSLGSGDLWCEFPLLPIL